MLTQKTLGAFVVGAVVAVASVSATAIGPIKSYDAQYEVRLIEASTTSGPRAAVGTLDMRVAETCEGWDTKSRVVMDLAFRDGTTLTNERLFTSFESRDGKTYDFAVRTVKGGVAVEAFKGSARIKRSGSVSYELPPSDDKSKPRKIVVPLPRGTLLPIAYMRELLDHASRGEALFRTIVFNGASSAGPRTLSASIARQQGDDDLGDRDANIDQALLSQPAWDLSLAYFNVFERRDTPNFEVFQRYHATGITPSFEQEFQDFRIAADLRKLKELPAPSCGGGAGGAR